MFSSSICFVGCSCFINVFLCVFIYIYLCPTWIPYQMTFVPFNSNIAGVANVTETNYLSETGPSGRDGMVVGFIITYAISAYQH